MLCVYFKDKLDKRGFDKFTSLKTAGFIRKTKYINKENRIEVVNLYECALL
jgi:hypothetical protein